MNRILRSWRGSSPTLKGPVTSVSLPISPSPISADSSAIRVDKNFSYAVLVSYAEVYNEKVRVPKGGTDTDAWLIRLDLRPARRCPPNHAIRRQDA